MPTQERHTVSLRIQAGEMLVAGHSTTHIARELGISDTTVRKYRGIVERGGLTALQDLPLGGRRSVLDSHARNRLADALRGSPRQYAIDADRWTIGAVASLIRRDFGLSFSRVYVRQIIIDLGFGDRLRTMAFSSTPGNPPKLDAEGHAWICAIVKRPPNACGIEADRWTNARLRLAVKARYGVTYSRRAATSGMPATY
ncbi:helix-turn-helix domain-containing protein [Paraburkholderia hospita]|uniref:helix-turn-helix domain-containing protein n=1 Tax=Paraburkholderia hospita TaxID=169430 RepID=UPI000F0A21CB|nr:helix-turn-helix domain-containing protein [Paraburkholderia hospita]